MDIKARRTGEGNEGDHPVARLGELASAQSDQRVEEAASWAITQDYWSLHGC